MALFTKRDVTDGEKDTKMVLGAYYSSFSRDCRNNLSKLVLFAKVGLIFQNCSLELYVRLPKKNDYW